MKKRLYLMITLGWLILFAGPSNGAGAKNTPAPAASPAAKSAPLTNGNGGNSSANNSDAPAQVAQLERTLFWLGMFTALGLILPLPMCLYHFRRVNALLARIEELQQKTREQEALSARVESLLSRNEKLETEIKHVQERFRVTMRNSQDKYQDTIDKLRSDIIQLETENKRISGLLLLKEQVSKKL
jgi:hypothetical protein